MKSVRCPLDCWFMVHVDYGPKEARLTEKQAMEKMVKHIREDHSVGQIFEWLERCMVQYFTEELKQWRKGV